MSYNSLREPVGATTQRSCALSPVVGTAQAEPGSSRPVRRDSAGRFVRDSGRPPARRGGGTPGNLNAVRNPWTSYWRRRALRPDDRWVLRLVEDYVPSLVADKGGDTEVSFGQRKVMELAGVARVCWALAMAAGNLEMVARFVGAERAALADLGLERRQRHVDPLERVRQAVERANAPRNGTDLEPLIAPSVTSGDAPERAQEREA